MEVEDREKKVWMNDGLIGYLIGLGLGHSEKEEKASLLKILSLIPLPSWLREIRRKMRS